ncbi:uncharacterized protein EI97DRAFT_287214 [Westerdykella ornata]|uniref:Uncharacterized protein n=1 Tax=Westerdykella ornata TaxID=318751 RepID=A0A6A6JL37_WESOR|nr:uncharacterized protein EI97DRAFT_287214 [Westerdykella ornata]KAF2277301.1 hypothetical protein EI97DRAFT_287214 [Westerdykella ornata]
MPRRPKGRADPKSPVKERPKEDSTDKRLPRNPNEMKNRTLQEALKGAADSGHVFAMSPSVKADYKTHDGPVMNKKALRKFRKEGRRGAENVSVPQTQASERQTDNGECGSSGVTESVPGTTEMKCRLRRLSKLGRRVQAINPSPSTRTGTQINLQRIPTMPAAWLTAIESGQSFEGLNLIMMDLRHQVENLMQLMEECNSKLRGLSNAL